MSAKSNATKKAEKRAKDKAQGVRDMIFPALPGTLADIGALMNRYHLDDWRELVTLLLRAVRNGDFPDPLPVPQHEYVPSEKMLRQLERMGILQAKQQDEDDG